MAELNQQALGKSGPTDVLSFPLDSGDDVWDLLPDEGDEPLPILLGDVVLCPPVARRQAPEHAGTVEAELTLLVIHGVLHVLGHDHAEADEAERMRDRERHHLARYGFDHPGPIEAAPAENPVGGAP
jgi:probable rRNA maturation factor